MGLDEARVPDRTRCFFGAESMTDELRASPRRASLDARPYPAMLEIARFGSSLSGKSECELHLGLFFGIGIRFAIIQVISGLKEHSKLLIALQDVVIAR